jgi:hypothetical protein
MVSSQLEHLGPTIYRFLHGRAGDDDEVAWANSLSELAFAEPYLPALSEHTSQLSVLHLHLLCFAQG